MVRLSLVNLYLHGFVEPHIFEYDTLTSEERWNEYADVILANPPFMSPKGGIRPHSRFSVKSKRSEVLFVDYMAEHLTPAGRAGIIVPEGIIFQSQNAHKQLRKMLVENYLVAVVSLPAGVFNPYSGVKTSILLLDKALARRADRIAFFKVENDGFALGAQRRPIDKNDLPRVTQALKEYLSAVRAGMNNAGNMDGPVCVRATRTGRQEMQDNEKSSPSSLSMLRSLIKQGTALIVEKEKIGANGEYNLSGERYREREMRPSKWPMVRLGDVVKAKSGNSKVIKGTLPKENDGSMFPAYSATGQDVFSPRHDYEGVGIIISAVGARCGKCFLATGRWQAIANTHVLIPDEEKVIPDYLFKLINKEDFWIKSGVAQPFVKVRESLELQIPLPPLEVQREIVAEIDGYQRVIDGARAVVDNYRPHIVVDPAWPARELSKVAIRITDGTHTTPNYTDSGIPFLRVTDITKSNASKKFISEEEHMKLIKRCHPQKGDVLYSKNGTIGVAKVIDWEGDFSIFVSLALIKPRRELVDSRYLEYCLNSDTAYEQATSRSKSGTVTNLHLVDIKTIQIPLPPLTKQQAIVAEIKAEQALVDANRELIERFEEKIQAAIGRVWGENKTEGR